MSVADTSDTTSFGIMTGADALTGGLISGIADVGAIAQQVGATAVQVNTAQARANAPVVATPIAVNSVTGQMQSGFSLGGLTANPIMLLLIVGVIILIVKH